MNKAQMTYFKDEYVLYLAISEGQEANSGQWWAAKTRYPPYRKC